MICRLINNANIKWDYLNITYKEFKQLLPYILKPVQDWPPNPYPWSIRDDIQILFLVSNAFETKQDLITWLTNHLERDLNMNAKFVLNFIYGSDNKTTTSDLFFIIQAILERSLLWYDPTYSWSSCYCHMLQMANEIYLQKGNKVDLSNITLGNPYIDYYELKKFPHTYIYSKLKEHCDDLIQFGKSQYDEKDLFLQAYQTLITSINMFSGKYIDLVGYSYELQLDKLIKKETLWCKKQCDSLKELPDYTKIQDLFLT